MFKQAFLSLSLLSLLSVSPLSAKKAAADSFQISGEKFKAERVLDNTTLLGDDRATIILSNASEDTSSNISFELFAGEDSSKFRKALKIDIKSSNSDDLDIDEDFEFEDSASVIFYHTKAINDTAVTYTNDAESSVTGTLTLKKYNSKTGKATFSFSFKLNNALVSTIDADLNESLSRATEIPVSGEFITDLID